MVVVPLAVSQINWPALQQVTGRSLTRIIDNENKQPTIATYLSVLDSFVGINKSVNDSISEANFGLEHISFSFIVDYDSEECSELVRYCTGMSILISEIDKKWGYHMILTANLKVWKQAITSIEGDIHREIRLMFNQIQGYLEQAGFSGIFSQYNKSYQQDKTFKLTWNR